MNSSLRHCSIIAAVAAFFTSPVQAAPASDFKYTLSTSLWTTHFNPRPEHNNTQEFIGLERWGENFVSIPLNERFPVLEHAEPVVGLAHFQNSFAQSTIYAYAGYRYDFYQLQQVQFFSKVTFGFIHGYRGEFQHKIPFNNFGTSPAAIPSAGIQYQRFQSEFILFGTSGLMLNVGFSF